MVDKNKIKGDIVMSKNNEQVTKEMYVVDKLSREIATSKANIAELEFTILLLKQENEELKNKLENSKTVEKEEE